jgi:hypothetical protein
VEQVGTALVADAEAATAEQPGERALDYPAMPSQSLAGLHPPARNPRRDTAGAQGTPEEGGVVGLVGVQFAGALAGATWSSSWSDDRGDGINEGEQLGRVVGIGRRETDRQRDTVPIHHQVVLGPGFATVDRVRPSLLAPLLARTLKESRLARLQLMAASSPSQLSSLSCSRCQTPASCQSRKRRQQVVPLPQPSSFGSSRHGQPVLSTNTMPARAARSGRRGRPPFGFGGSCGSRGSIASQRASGTRDEVFMTSDHATARGVLKHALSL